MESYVYSNPCRQFDFRLHYTTLGLARQGHAMPVIIIRLFLLTQKESFLHCLNQFLAPIVCLFSPAVSFDLKNMGISRQVKGVTAKMWMSLSLSVYALVMESPKLGLTVKAFKEENDSNNLTLWPSFRVFITKVWPEIERNFCCYTLYCASLATPTTDTHRIPSNLTQPPFSSMT